MLRKLLLKLQNLLSPQKPLQPEKQSSGGLNLLQDSFKDEKNGDRTGDTPFGKIDLADIRVSEGVLRVLRISTLIPLLLIVVLIGVRIYLDSELKVASEKANISALEINRQKKLRTEYEAVVATQKIYSEISQNKITLYPKVNLLYESLVPNLSITALDISAEKTTLSIESIGSIPFVYYLDTLLKNPMVSKVILESASVDNKTQKMLIGIQIKFSS